MLTWAKCSLTAGTHLVFLSAPKYLTLDGMYHGKTAFVFVWGFSILFVGLPLIHHSAMSGFDCMLP